MPERLRSGREGVGRSHRNPVSRVIAEQVLSAGLGA